MDHSHDKAQLNSSTFWSHALPRFHGAQEEIVEDLNNGEDGKIWVM
jgi:hypothetical protein